MHKSVKTAYSVRQHVRAGENEMRRIRLVVAVVGALASVVVGGGTPTAHAYQGVGGGQVAYRAHDIPGGCFGEPCVRLSGWTFTGTLDAPTTWTGTFTGSAVTEYCHKVCGSFSGLLLSGTSNNGARLTGSCYGGTSEVVNEWVIGIGVGQWLDLWCDISIRRGAAVPVHISLMTEAVVGDAVRAAWTTACRYPVPCRVPD